MNDIRIIDWVNHLFADVEQTDRVLEQKEELQIHLTDRIKDYMANAMNFDEAFRLATEDMGNVDELKEGFQAKKADFRKNKEDWDDDWDEEDWDENEDSEQSGGFFNWKLTALSPFIFLLLGFAFDWWSWAWVIIPVTGILSSGMGKGLTLVALTPFIYVTVGIIFGGWMSWWAWGWVIIPVSGILLHDK